MLRIILHLCITQYSMFNVRPDITFLKMLDNSSFYERARARDGVVVKQFIR